MKRLLFSLALVFSFVQQAQATGLFYTNATYPVTASGHPVDLTKLKQGQSEALNVLYIFETGDAGISRAAKDAGIKKVYFVDVNEKSVFIFFRKITTSVYGE